VTPVSESSRPATCRRRRSRASKGLRCCALVAALFVGMVPPAAAQEPEPEPTPTPTLPDPDPAPAPAPAPAPKPARPAPAKPAARPAPTPTPRYVAPEVTSPTPRAESVRVAPVPAAPKAPAKPAVPKPAETIRHLPIRDSSIVRFDETPLVLAAAGEDGGGVSATALVAVIWLGLAGVLLLVACVTPFLAVAGRLNDRRGQFALIGTNMVVAAVVGYLVVAVTS
jgi:hypothetical protein